MVATASVAAGPATANADPSGHQVQYTVTTDAPYDFTVTYLVNQPASKAAFNADSNSYLKRDTVHIGPDAPWVVPTTLADPQWAFLQVASTQHGGQGAPGAHCLISVDGQVVSQRDDPYNPQCLMGQWG
jgi:hypothetical protein